MVYTSLFFSGFLIIGFGMMGFIFGWFGREYFEQSMNQYSDPSHPEMYDESGNPIVSELYSVRFIEEYEEED